MKHNKANARRAFWWVVLVVFLLVCLVDAAAFWALRFVSQPMASLAAAGSDLPEAVALTGTFATVKQHLMIYGLPASFLFFLFAVMLLWLGIRRQFKTPLQAAKSPGKTTQGKAVSARAEKRAQDQRMFLYLMSLLQREGRLMDFLSEDLSPFDDAQIGAAVRGVHESCKKVVEKNLAPKPVVDKEEGTSITVEPGFDPGSIKLVGNVSGDPPFPGVLRHRGWQAKKTELPALSGTRDASIIAPAEVEIV